MSIRRSFFSKYALWAASWMALLLPLVSHAELAGIDVPGSKRLTVADWGGAPITLWYLRGADTKADAPIVFVMHGVGRDADRYLSEWLDIAFT